MTDVVILGAGFAGLAAARELSQSGATVTLVDRNVYSTFQPLLYEVATGGLNPGDISYPVRTFTRKQQLAFRCGEVAALGTTAGLVELNGGASLRFDYLIVATGAVVNFFGVPGAAEHALSLYRRGDAIHLRDRLMAALEGLASAGEGECSIVVIGGGATGVEMAGTLAELCDVGLRAVYPEIDPKRVHVHLVEQGPELVAPFARRLRRYTLGQLERRGVQVHASTSVAAVAAGEVILQGGHTLRSDLTVWAAGVAAPDWGLPKGAGGRISVAADLRVEGLERVFAVGDVAVGRSFPLPQLAQPAIQSGRHAGRQIRRLMAGEATEPFVYRDKGTMATIGRHAAIVELPHGILLTGVLAWFAWLGLHLLILLGARNRLSALLNLSWRYVTWPEHSGVIVGDMPEED